MLKDCKYFEGTGNFCSRVTAMRCDEFPECEFKYIAELKAENERLKAECDMYKTFYRAKHSDIKGLFLNYKQTLQEIKKIAEQCMNKDTCYDCQYYDDCYVEDAEIPTYDICKLFIQLITKAESEG